MKKLLLLGGGETLKDAPIKDKDYDVWAVASINQMLDEKDVDAWIEIHSKKVLTNIDKWKEISKLKKPIYMQKHYKDIKSSIAYPLKEITERLGTYFTSSLAYMLVLAFYLGYEDVELYGFDQVAKVEYEEHNPCINYWIGYLRSSGVKVKVPEISSILRCNYMYGFEEKNRLQQFHEDSIKKSQEMNKRIAEENKKLQDAIEKNNMQAIRNNGVVHYANVCLKRPVGE